MFVYGGPGETSGPDVVTNKEFYKKVANEFTALLSTYTTEGQCYRVDLRLRPDGTGGEVCISEEAALAYYSERARDWEKQMLIKARISAGDTRPGALLLESVEPLIYQSSLDFRAVEAVSETRQRIAEKLASRRHRPQDGLDVKLTPGGIRDIEFLVQCLQRLHGGREQWVRHGGTLFALFRLRDKELLSDGEYARLVTAYEFLRNLEHRLQMEEDRQTHVLPANGGRLDLVARKMPGGVDSGAELKQRLEEHLAAVREIYDRVVCADRPGVGMEVRAAAAAPKDTRLERFVEAGGVVDERVRDLFGHSAYFGDQLLRYPELVQEIGKPFELEKKAPTNLGMAGWKASATARGEEEAEDSAALRRFYRTQMLRIQSESMAGGRGHRGGVPDCVARGAFAGRPGVYTARSDDGDRARTARDARVRSGQRRGCELHHPGCR